MTESEKLDLILEKLCTVDKLEDRFDKFEDRIDKLEDRFDKFEDRIDKLEDRFGKFEDRIDKLEDRFDKFEDRIDKLEDRFDKLEVRFDEMANELKAFKTRLDNMEQKMDKLDGDFTSVKLMLENEIRPNIMRVAEGHLDLYRKFKEATKIEEEKEMIAIRVGILETELRTIKERLDQIA